MYAQRKFPVLVAAFVAVVGTVGILFNDYGLDSASQDSGDARMITAAAVAKAGAIEIPSALPAGRSMPGTERRRRSAEISALAAARAPRRWLAEQVESLG